MMNASTSAETVTSSARVSIGRGSARAAEPEANTIKPSPTSTPPIATAAQVGPQWVLRTSHSATLRNPTPPSTSIPPNSPDSAPFSTRDNRRSRSLNRPNTGGDLPAPDGETENKPKPHRDRNRRHRLVPDRIQRGIRAFARLMGIPSTLDRR